MQLFKKLNDAGTTIIQVTHSERNAACCISLPMFPELTEEEVDYTVDKVLEWDRRAR